MSKKTGIKEKAQYIKWIEDPIVHATRAYQEGFFLEAVQVIHGFIEAKMRDLIMVSRHGNIKSGYEEIWPIAQEMGFNVLARALFVGGKITKKEFNELQKFNSLRNRVVHKFFWEPYDGDYKGVPRKEYDALLDVGKSLLHRIFFKADSVIGRRLDRDKKTREKRLNESAR